MSWELPDRISVREVGPRDGLQNEDPVPTEAKVALLDALSATGVQRIEAVAHDRGATVQVIVSTAWGCPYEGDVPVPRVVAVAGRAIADGADSASFGDTTGMATPGRVRELVGAFRSAHPGTGLNLHFHNTR